MKNFISTYLKDKIEGLNSIKGTLIDKKNTYVYGSEIGSGVVIGEYAKIHKATINGEVQIGRFTAIWGPNIEIMSGVHPIKIGQFCSIAKNTSIMEYNHSTSRVSTYLLNKNLFNKGQKEDIVSKGPIEIGNDVWIGSNSCILSGVKIGNGSIIGAGSVVTKDIKPYSIAIGNPAKTVKFRFNEEIIQLLNKLQWWNWSIEKIIQYQEFFQSHNISMGEILETLENEANQ